MGNPGEAGQSITLNEETQHLLLLDIQSPAFACRGNTPPQQLSEQLNILIFKNS